LASQFTPSLSLPGSLWARLPLPSTPPFSFPREVLSSMLPPLWVRWVIPGRGLADISGSSGGQRTPRPRSASLSLWRCEPKWAHQVCKINPKCRGCGTALPKYNTNGPTEFHNESKTQRNCVDPLAGWFDGWLAASNTSIQCFHSFQHFQQFQQAPGKSCACLLPRYLQVA